MTDKVCWFNQWLSADYSWGVWLQCPAWTNAMLHKYNQLIVSLVLHNSFVDDNKNIHNHQACHREHVSRIYLKSPLSLRISTEVAAGLLLLSKYVHRTVSIVKIKGHQDTAIFKPQKLCLESWNLTVDTLLSYLIRAAGGSECLTAEAGSWCEPDHMIRVQSHPSGSWCI